MPIRNPDGLGELYLLQPNGYRVRLGNVVSAQTVVPDYSVIDVDELDNSVIIPMYENVTSFEVKWVPNIEDLYFLIHGVIPTNNWRKMHGYSLRKKTTKRKKRKGVNHARNEVDSYQGKAT